MTVELITGHAGAAHVSSADAGWLNAGIVGTGKYVLDTDSHLEATVQSANLVTIAAGDAMFEGRHVRVSTAESVTIDNGAQGMNRHDIICIKYEYDSVLDVESASIVVVKGTASSSTPSDPTIPSGSILGSSSTAYMPLWRIPIEGLAVGTPVKLFGDIVPTTSDMLTKTWTASQIPNLPASKITSGTLGAARIPSLDASKIGSGTLDAARIPSIDASKVTSGTFADARIPNLNASKITAGTLPVARGGTGKTSGIVWMADTLYNNATGTTGTVTLTASAANYSMLEIFYRDNDSHCGSVKLFSPNDRTACLSMSTGTTNGGMNHKRRDVTVSGTSITNQSYAEQAYDGTITTVNHIYVIAVVGYK